MARYATTNTATSRTTIKTAVADTKERELAIFAAKALFFEILARSSHTASP